MYISAFILHLLSRYVIVDMNVHDVEAFGKEMFRAFHVELFVHGNATEEVTIDELYVELSLL